MSLRISLEPFDTVFFRDSRPFEAGMDAIADSVQPSALTMFGIVGALYLEKQGISFTDFKRNGSGKKLGDYDPELKRTKLRLKGPFIQYDEKVYLPPPSDVWTSGAGTRAHRVKPQDTIPYQWDIEAPCVRPLSLPHFAERSETQPEPLEKYLSLQGMNSYLAMKDISLRRYAKGEQEFFLKEDRTGHSINSATNTVNESMLYSARHIRSKDSLSYQGVTKAKFIVDVEGLDADDISSCVTGVGGEGRLASVCVQASPVKLMPTDDAVLEEITRSRRFLVYLATPAIFEKGWYGDWARHFPGAVMTGACVNKPGAVSGWMKNGSGAGGNPRALLKTAPAGSVYFFKADADTWGTEEFEKMYRDYHYGKSVSDHYPNAGFGSALIGAW